MDKAPKIILGIETSCDDTSVGLLQGREDTRPEVLALASFGQGAALKKWGGVVPEIAARNHLAKLVPLLCQAFAEAGIGPGRVDTIGVTTHPGLLGPLLTGLNAAKTLSLLHQIPIVPVNHLYAHVEAIHLVKDIPYPYLGLIASGGHSLFALAHSSVEFEILAGTVDDAAGEAFDKGGKLMGLDYPAGREIDQLATLGDRQRYTFPIGLQHSKDARLSFSGLKTSLRAWLQKHGRPAKNGQVLRDLCASYQEAIVSALALKASHALALAQGRSGHNEIPLVVGGGVACNRRLREVLGEQFPGVHFVPPQYCTDNAAMVANYAWRTRKAKAVDFPDALSLDAQGKFVRKGRTKGATHE